MSHSLAGKLAGCSSSSRGQIGRLFYRCWCLRRKRRRRRRDGGSFHGQSGGRCAVNPTSKQNNGPGGGKLRRRRPTNRFGCEPKVGNLYALSTKDRDKVFGDSGKKLTDLPERRAPRGDKSRSAVLSIPGGRRGSSSSASSCWTACSVLHAWIYYSILERAECLQPTR